MIGRFQVMAILQSARAYILGMDIESAKSFGLNRAIFYAAAKKGFFKGKITLKDLKLPKEILGKYLQKPSDFKIEKIGDEIAYSIEIEGKKYFIIGNKPQTPQDFYKQVESRFKGKFEKAWKEALEICKKYDRGILLSQRYFYETVYKPRRDELAKKWTQMVLEK